VGRFVVCVCFGFLLLENSCDFSVDLCRMREPSAARSFDLKMVEANLQEFLQRGGRVCVSFDGSRLRRFFLLMALASCGSLYHDTLLSLYFGA
jgi:hypothetical protein